MAAKKCQRFEGNLQGEPAVLARLTEPLPRTIHSGVLAFCGNTAKNRENHLPYHTAVSQGYTFPFDVNEPLAG